MRVIRGCGIAVALFVLLPTTAHGAPATLLSASHKNGLLTATWSLPPGARAQFLEAARSPATASDGSFLPENVVLRQQLGWQDTNINSTAQMPLGLTYLHIGTDQANCLSCLGYEWSNVLTFTVSSVFSQPQAPPLSLAASPVARRQRIDRLLVGAATLGPPATIVARATINVPRAARLYRSRPATAVTAGGPDAAVRLQLRFSRNAQRAAKRAMRRGKKLRARVTVTASDNEGHSAARRFSIRLKP